MNDAIRLYLKHLAAATDVIDDQDVAFYYNNPLFYLSHLAVDPKFSLFEMDNCLVFDATEWATVLPLDRDRASFLGVIRKSLKAGRPLLRLPSWVEPHFGDCTVADLWPDFVGDTLALQSMAGRRLKGLRQPIQRLERSGRAESFLLGPGQEAAVQDVISRWYEDRAPILGELYQEAEIRWLFQNLAWLQDHVPGTFGMGVRVDGQLVAANLSCILSKTVWVCHTERYDPRSLTYVNQMAFRDACRQMEAHTYPWVNDGAAEAYYIPETPNLASFKLRLASYTVTPVGIWVEGNER